MHNKLIMYINLCIHVCVHVAITEVHVQYTAYLLVVEQTPLRDGWV